MKSRTFHLGDIIRTLSYRGHQTNQNGFHHKGTYPIIDQGQKAIAGYTSSVQPIRDVPVVIFGDHTRIVKFVSCPFVVGADGVKLLKSADPHVSDRLLYWLASAVAPKLPTVGYGRHFSALRDAVVAIDANQSNVTRNVNALDKCEECATALDDLIAAAREQKRGLMQQLLTGKVRFPGFTEPWKTVRVGDVLEAIERPVEWSDSDTYRLVSIRRRNGGLFLREELVGSAIASKSLFVVAEGDLLLSRMQVVHGAIAIVPPSLSGTHVSGMYFCLGPKPGRGVRTAFVNLVAHLPLMRKITMACSHGVHIEKMTFDPRKFMDAKLRIPSDVREQDRIVALFTKIDGELALLEAQRISFAAQRRGLLERLLSGDIALSSSDTSAA